MNTNKTSPIEERVRQFAKAPSSVQHTKQIVKEVTPIDRLLLNEAIKNKIKENRNEHIAGIVAILNDDSVYKSDEMETEGETLRRTIKSKKI